MVATSALDASQVKHNVFEKEEGMGIADRDEVKELFKYPLLEAIARRRARRFPLGCTLSEGGASVCFGTTSTAVKRPRDSYTMLVPIWLQAYHRDLDFYDEYYPRDMVTEA